MSVRCYVALAGAGFRRHSTYRQAMIAGAFTNIVFGFLRCYVLLSVAGSVGTVAGYDRAQLATFVWVGQGLIAVVSLWSVLDLAERVRSGDVLADLLRPVDPIVSYLATDLGRAGYAALTRFVLPVGVGMLAFDFALPAHPATYPLFAVSVALAVLVCFAGRYLVGLTSFWLLDVRGVHMAWVFLSGGASGLYFPLPVLPEWANLVLWVATPFPAMLQAPLDIAVERGGFGHAALVLLAQTLWTVALLACCRQVQRRALGRLVLQGG